MRKTATRTGLFFIMTFSTFVLSSEAPPAAAPIKTDNNMDFYTIIQDIAKAGIKENEKNSEILELKIQIQTDKIEELEQEIEKLKEKPESNTASIVLAAASLIITALGVLIAILSILGYSNIKKEAMKTSSDTAKAIVASIAGAELMTATENNIIQLMESGRFDKIIQDAVENITYRGIDEIGIEGEVK